MNKKLCTLCQIVLFSVTLKDPNPDFHGTPLFDIEYHTNSATQT